MRWSFFAAAVCVSGITVPDARPPPELRKFNSTAVEAKIEQVAALIGDANLRQFFKNTYPSTLDTTVLWARNGADPRSFVITGDIPAMWLRDSMNQVIHYIPVMADDVELARMILGVVLQQAEFISYYPWGNAFKAPPESGIDSGENGWANSDEASKLPPDGLERVWESKYELDSLAAFLRLATVWYEGCTAGSQCESEGLKSILEASITFQEALKTLVTTMKSLQPATWEATAYTDNKPWGQNPPFTFRRLDRSPTESVPVGGQGNPVKRTGMVRSYFRPSDDSCILPFLVPSNAMAAVALNKAGASQMIQDGALKKEVTDLGAEIEMGIEVYGRTTVDGVEVYAFEVDGFGGAIFMDDANVPSLLSLPDLGYLELSGETTPDQKKTRYQKTRAKLLTRDTNPWFFQSDDPTQIWGIGGPHTGLDRVWMMAVAMEGLTVDDSDPSVYEVEVKKALDRLLLMQAGTGLMHEGVHPNDPNRYSRQWFAWANTVFGQLILKLSESDAGKAILSGYTSPQ